MGPADASWRHGDAAGPLGLRLEIAAVSADRLSFASSSCFGGVTNSVEALECGPKGLEPRAAREALSSLADALKLRSGLPAPASQKVRKVAGDLASDSAAVSSIEAIHNDLSSALQALLAQPGPVEYRGAVAKLGRSLDAMHAPTPRAGPSRDDAASEAWRMQRAFSLRPSSGDKPAAKDR